MAGLREIRRRIRSVKNTAQITKAMQMVAASRMRKAQDQALAGRPFAFQLGQIISRVAGASESGLSDFSHPYLSHGEGDRTLVVTITTDRGLCGALNSNLLRKVNDRHEQQPEGSRSYVTIGRKGKQFLARMKRNLDADFEMGDVIDFKESRRVSNYLIKQFEQGNYDRVVVYFNFFVNTVKQEPTRFELLPISKESLERFAQAGEDAAVPGSNPDYLFEPGPEQLLGEILPYYIHLEFYQMLLNAKASEHSARMVAMKNATDNAKQLVKDLTLEFNKARQAAITNEILEIATAQVALG